MKQKQTTATEQLRHVQHRCPLPVNVQLLQIKSLLSLLPGCQQECPISANLFLVTRTPVTKEFDKNNQFSHCTSKLGAQINHLEVNRKPSTPTAKPPRTSPSAYGHIHSIFLTNGKTPTGNCYFFPSNASYHPFLLVSYRLPPGSSTLIVIMDYLFLLIANHLPLRWNESCRRRNDFTKKRFNSLQETPLVQAFLKKNL